MSTTNDTQVKIEAAFSIWVKVLDTDYYCGRSYLYISKDETYYFFVLDKLAFDTVSAASNR